MITLILKNIIEESITNPEKDCYLSEFCMTRLDMSIEFSFLSHCILLAYAYNRTRQ